METREVRMINPTELAFVGDAVFELMVRDHLARHHTVGPSALHKMSVEYVCARSQSQFVRDIEDLLNEEESTIVRRGRNASRVTVPRNVEPRDYRLATGFEALFGYLHLCGRQQRIEELFCRVIECHDMLFAVDGAVTSSVSINNTAENPIK